MHHTIVRRLGTVLLAPLQKVPRGEMATVRRFGTVLLAPLHKVPRGEMAMVPGGGAQGPLSQSQVG